MGTAISAVRNGRNVLKRRVDVRHDDGDIDGSSSPRHPKRMREDIRIDVDEASPPASADTTLVNDTADEHDILEGTKGKARDDTVSLLLICLG